jgi:hypothetical protein
MRGHQIQRSKYLRSQTAPFAALKQTFFCAGRWDLHFSFVQPSAGMRDIAEPVRPKSVSGELNDCIALIHARSRHDAANTPIASSSKYFASRNHLNASLISCK